MSEIKALFNENDNYNELKKFIGKNRNGVIAKMLKNISLKQELFSLIEYLSQLPPFYINDLSNCYILSTNEYMKITGKATKETASHHLNYFCALGFIDKVQYDVAEVEIISKIMERNRYNHSLNIIHVPAYDIQRFKLIKERAKLLQLQKITAGNISYTLLYERGLKQIANDIYFRNDRNAPKRKQKNLDIVLYVIDNLTAEQHYCTVQQVLDSNIGITKSEIKKVLKIYRSVFVENYRYGRPTTHEKNNLHLTKDTWIFRERKEKRNEHEVPKRITKNENNNFTRKTKKPKRDCRPQYIKKLNKLITMEHDMTVKDWHRYFKYWYKKNGLNGDFKQLYSDDNTENFYRVRKHIPPYIFIAAADNDYRIFSVSKGVFKELSVNFESQSGREYISICRNKKCYKVSLSMLVLLAYGTEQTATEQALQQFDELGITAFHNVQCHHINGYNQPTGMTNDERKRQTVIDRRVNCNPSQLMLLTDEEHKELHRGGYITS